MNFKVMVHNVNYTSHLTNYMFTTLTTISPLFAKRLGGCHLFDYTQNPQNLIMLEDGVCVSHDQDVIAF